MNRIVKLSNAMTTLGNHVAAVVRMSNRMDALLKDAVQPVTVATKDAIIADLKAMHDDFRVSRFRGMIAAVNVVTEIVTELYKEEPVDPAEPEIQASAADGAEVDLPETADGAEVDLPETADGAEVDLPETHSEELSPSA